MSLRDKKPVTILIADDDPDDRAMIKEAFEENLLRNVLHFVENGEELMNYLNRSGKYSDTVEYPMPGLILLDLNMPRKDGREALEEIKSSPQLSHIPIIILTTSKTEEDIIKSYNLGVNCFISKPVKFVDLVQVTKTLGRFWLEIVTLPSEREKNEK
jgi:CheY-like chemotaxis protein